MQTSIDIYRSGHSRAQNKQSFGLGEENDENTRRHTQSVGMLVA